MVFIFQDTPGLIHSHVIPCQYDHGEKCQIRLANDLFLWIYSVTGAHQRIITGEVVIYDSQEVLWAIWVLFRNGGSPRIVVS